jgi:hypothetical protein
MLKLQIRNSTVLVSRDQLKTENLKINIELTSSKDIVELSVRKHESNKASYRNS